MYLSLYWVYSQASFLWESHFTESPRGSHLAGKFRQEGWNLRILLQVPAGWLATRHWWQLCRLKLFCMIHVFWFLQDGFRWIHTCWFHGPIPFSEIHFNSIFLQLHKFTRFYQYFCGATPPSPPISIMFRFRYTAHRIGCATKVVLRGAFKHPASLVEVTKGCDEPQIGKHMVYNTPSN